MKITNCATLPNVILRVIRVVLIVAGLALLGFGTYLVADSEKTGGHIHASWTCDPDQSATGGMECRTVNGGYGGPGDLGDVVDFLMMPLIGIGLIGASIAIGQFERRPLVATAAPPMQPAATGAPSMQPGQQPMQQGQPGQHPRWTGQNPGPPQQY